MNMERRTIARTDDGYALNALQDIPDLRDWPFEPSLRKLSRYIRPPSGLIILDQQQEGACTGFGLAAIINMLNQERGNDVIVSPRMLYEMAKRHDEWQGEDYAGSSCRGAIKGWYNMGVCRDSMWKYKPNKPGDITVPRAKDARKNTIGAYYRIQPRVSDFHAALNEAGAIYCSATTHRGWQQPHKKTHVIPFRKEPLGGHAFAIVGYNNRGFWVQNSWGSSWGKGGLGLWLYEDWHQNLMDAWVFSLAIPTPKIWHLPEAGDKNRSGLSLRPSPPRSDIAGHFVHIDDGEFHSQGRYWSTAVDVRETARELVKDAAKYQHLLFYAHGGLNSPKDSAGRVAAMKKTFKDNGIYPYHFMYDTGILEEIKDIVFRHKDAVESRAGGFTDWTDQMLEWAIRIPGRALWREMKNGASLPFFPNGAGSRTLQIFLDELARDNGLDLTVHVAGHSTGGILLASLLEAMEDMAPELRLSSCSLLAPACSIDLFRSHYFPYLVEADDSFGIDRMRIFNLTRKQEKDDQVALVYRKSLLYLVSRAFEEEMPEEILGMNKYANELVEEQAIQDLGDRFRIFTSSIEDDSATQSTTHVGFDNDPATMNTVLETILGEAPAIPFTREVLDY